MTARDLIRGSMRLLGVIATGENASADEMVDGIAAFNAMLDSWSTENLMVLQGVPHRFTLPPGQSVYTYGAGGDLDSDRPLDVMMAGLISGSGDQEMETPIEVINVQEYQAIANKNLQGSMPSKLYIEDTFPLAKLRFWTVPSESVAIVLYSSTPLSKVTSPNQTLILPPGMERALRYNLAIEMSPEYGVEPKATVLSIALESKANVKRKNAKPVYMTSDVLLLTRPESFNIYTGGDD